jgi:hypothetical protein
MQAGPWAAGLTPGSSSVREQQECESADDGKGVVSLSACSAVSKVIGPKFAPTAVTLGYVMLW